MTLLNVGDTISDRYDIDSYIGAGGMQEVYLAFDQTLKRNVALKVPKNADMNRRFRKSAAISARVTHHNVAKTLDYVEEDNQFYLVEEYIDGDDLQKILGSLPFLDPYSVSYIFQQLAKGLAASHRAGVTHRDLKPRNLMIGGSLAFKSVKVTDFGIARMAEEEFTEVGDGGEPTLSLASKSSTVFGAIPYLSPEMIDNPRGAGPPADIWALAAISYELLTGQKPFGTGLGAVKKIDQATGPPDLPSWIVNHRQFGRLAMELQVIFKKCMTHAVAERLTGDQLVQHCESLCYPPFTERVCGVVESHYRVREGWIQTEDHGKIYFNSKSVYSAQSTRPPIGTRVWLGKDPGEPNERAHPIVPMRAPAQ